MKSKNAPGPSSVPGGISGDVAMDDYDEDEDENDDMEEVSGLRHRQISIVSLLFSFLYTAVDLEGYPGKAPM